MLGVEARSGRTVGVDWGKETSSQTERPVDRVWCVCAEMVGSGVMRLFLAWWVRRAWIGFRDGIFGSWVAGGRVVGEEGVVRELIVALVQWVRDWDCVLS